MKHLLLGTVTMLAGCMPTPPTSAFAPRAATPVSASLAKTWNAIIDVFAERNIPIRTIDRASGFIATDALGVDAPDTTWADCGADGMGNAVRPQAATYNVLARGDSGSSTVHVTVTWASMVPNWGGTTSGVKCVSRGVWEGELEQEIRAKAEKK